MVDSFSYRNCSGGVDTRTEFCTGEEVVQPRGKVYEMDSSGTFRYVRDQMRGFRDDSLPRDAGESILSLWNYFVF